MMMKWEKQNREQKKQEEEEKDEDERSGRKRRNNSERLMKYRDTLHTEKKAQVPAVALESLVELRRVQTHPWTQHTRDPFRGKIRNHRIQGWNICIYHG
jgi:hypothetical protein